MSYTELETTAFHIVPPPSPIKGSDSPGGPPPIDITMLDQLEGMQGPDEPNLVAEIIGLFLDDTKQQLEQVESAVINRDIRKLKHAAHSLKGSSASLGANQLAGWCHLLEMVESLNDWSKVPKIFVNLKRTCSEACAFLELERERRQ